MSATKKQTKKFLKGRNYVLVHLGGVFLLGLGFYIIPQPESFTTGNTIVDHCLFANK